MRSRLLTVFLLPLIVVLLGLGGAYAWSSARSLQQEFHAEQLADLNYFVTSARQALRAGNSTVVSGEISRFAQITGAEAVIFDRSGQPWAYADDEIFTIDQELSDQVNLALSGRRSDAPQADLPWLFTDVTLVEPVFDDGDVIGAVVITASIDELRESVTRNWVLLIGLAVVAALFGGLIVVRMAQWVLKPLDRLDRAMESIERGEIEARIADDTGPPELRHMIRVFNSMAEQIERSLTRQREFALNASHELRNPLNALLVRMELLATGLGDEWTEDVEATREEGRRMVRILDTLLSLASSGHSDVDAQEVELRRLVEERIEAWSEVVHDRQIQFSISGDATAVRITDQMMVESAFDAVIDNAVKFSSDGSSIEIRVMDQADSTEILVRDHGPGVRESDLDHVAERFWRSPGNQNISGSGLGLAIASDLLTSLSGDLTVSSPEDGGFQVTLHIPSGSDG